ncbi:MAG: Recombinase [Parcubacteria group bacterium GW2011_GWA2_40_37]|nr:MAG: Recombinase [Parcubacteria group bacterium GW2011_GWA2_40_37]
MANFTTTAELVTAIQGLQSDENEVKSDTYRYVIYVRKSTDEKDKQVRSLGDQVDVCKEYALNNGLRVVKIIQEAESAKEPDIRPKFRGLLDDLKAGKYDGLIAWHPDRLARNMKDAGEIIDLLDKHIIKDLKFASFTFQNDTSGKMLLGISFVISKQYSDHLSDSVTRGNVKSIEEGKLINRAKHGYFKDRNQYLRPDGANFLLMKTAFKMRLEGKTMVEIATYLNESGYQKWHKDGKHRPFYMDKQKVQKFLIDPTYTGVLIYGKQTVDLATFYDFHPMLSVEEFMQINQLGNKSELIKLAKKHHKRENIKANLMRGMVICDACGEAMHAGITPKKTKDGVVRYFYYRCDTDDCDRSGKSIRAKVVMDYIYNFLDQKPFSSKASYKHYSTEMKRVAEERLIDAKKLLQSLQAQKRELDHRLLKTKELFLNDEDDDIKKHYKGDLKQIEEGLQNIEGTIEKQKEHIKKGQGGILTYEEFLELMEKTGQIMHKIKNMGELDYLCRKLYMNFTTDGKNIISATLSAPFNELYQAKVSQGGPQETRTPYPLIANEVLYQMS